MNNKKNKDIIKVEDIDNLLKDDSCNTKPTDEQLKEWRKSEFVTNMKGMKEKIKKCPKCGDEDLDINEIHGFIIIVKCKKCDYEESFVDEFQILS